MQAIKYPYFNKDRILKIEMLENLRDFPRDVLEIQTEDLSDGIICGLTPIVDQEIITFSKGIVKYKKELYVISDPVAISYSETGTDVIIKLDFNDETSDKDYRIRNIEITLDRDLDILDNQIEIGRFKLKSGAYLRSGYQDLYDFTTEYNTINIVNVLYCGYKQPTLSNLILKFFAKEALATRTQDLMDITFSMMCLNSSRVERDVIQNYIAYKLTEEINTSATNHELHQKLVKILEDIKQNNPSKSPKRAKGRKIIVD